MNSPNPFGRGSESDDLQTRANAPGSRIERGGGFTLQAMVERGLQELAEEGRTTAAWLARIEDLRAQGRLPSVPAEQRAMAVDEARAEREARYDEWRR